MEKKNDRNKNTSQNKLYSDEIKEMERLSDCLLYTSDAADE